MKHLLSLLSALIIFSFASCENNKVPLTKENLVGTWNVVEITNQNSDKFHKVGGIIQKKLENKSSLADGL